MHRDARLKIKGNIIRGTGKGKTFLAMPEYLTQFSRILGCTPYPGTLNLLICESEREKINEIEKLREKKGILVKGFERGEKRHLSGRAVECRVMLREHIFPALLYFPEKTHHPPEIMEIISCVRILDHADIGEQVVVVL